MSAVISAYHRWMELEDAAHKDGDWKIAFIEACQRGNTLAERLDALEAELAGWKLFADELVPFDPNNESEIKAAATAISKQFHELKTETERLRAELVTAHNDALEKAAQVCDKLAQNIYDEYGSTDQETGERMVPTRFMDTVEADEECAACIRALKDKP